MARAAASATEGMPTARSTVADRVGQRGCAAASAASGDEGEGEAEEGCRLQQARLVPLPGGGRQGVDGAGFSHQGDDGFGGAAAAAADAGDDHGFTAHHWVTAHGRAEGVHRADCVRDGRGRRVAACRPVGPGRASRASSVSTVTALATRRAIGWEGGPGDVDHAIPVGATAEEDGVGRGKAGERFGGGALDDGQGGGAAGGGVAGDARDAVGLGARWRWRGWPGGAASTRCRSTRRRHRRPTRNSPRRGARLVRVSARISRRVSWPSCSNSTSGRAGGEVVRDGAGDFDGDGV